MSRKRPKGEFESHLEHEPPRARVEDQQALIALPAASFPAANDGAPAASPVLELHARLLRVLLAREQQLAVVALLVEYRLRLEVVAQRVEAVLTRSLSERSWENTSSGRLLVCAHRWSASCANDSPTTML